MQVKEQSDHYPAFGVAKTQTPATLSVDRGVEQQELSLSAGGNADGAASLGDSWVVSYKSKLALTVQPSSCVPWYLSKGVKASVTQSPAHGCLQQLYSEWPNLGSNQDVLQQVMDELWGIQTMGCYGDEMKAAKPGKGTGELKCTWLTDRSQPGKMKDETLPDPALGHPGDVQGLRAE